MSGRKAHRSPQGLGPLVGARRREGPAWWRMDSMLNMDFTREAPIVFRPGKAGEQSCRMTGQEAGVLELLPSEWD